MIEMNQSFPLVIDSCELGKAPLRYPRIWAAVNNVGGIFGLDAAVWIMSLI